MYKDSSGVRVDFMALKEYYKVVRDNAKSILTSERDVQDLFQSREKPPHMWWYQFKVRIKNVLAVIDKNIGRLVHTYHMKLRVLKKKSNMNFLST